MSERVTPSLPFDPETVWEEAVCVNLRMHPDALRPLVPPAFELDLHQGHAFVSLTASRLKNFGVVGVPNALRTNFYQATYRAHVRYVDYAGRTRRGCYMVRSDTNSEAMSMAANALPEFRAHHCSTYPIVMARHQGNLVLTVDSGQDAAGKVVLVLDTEHCHQEMPAGSVFTSLAQARALLVDFDESYAHDADSDEILVLRIERGEWKIKVVSVVDSYLGFVSRGPLGQRADTVLDSVFYFREVPYRWLPLIREKRRADSCQG
ncbi:MAG: DUF2071 domain-containing protein [Myxococcales bacterium]